MCSFRRLAAFALLMAAASAYVSAQKPNPQMKLPPATLMDTPLVLWEPVVTRQWPATLQAVNLPGDLRELSPGQCIRVGVAATGEGHAAFLGSPSIRFIVSFAGHTDEVAAEAAGAFKDIKPEGTDFVQGALDAAGVAFVVPTSGTIAASTSHWCVPAEAAAGKAELRVVAGIHGHEQKLKPVSLTIETPDVPPTLPFKDAAGFSTWLQTYHLRPRAALLGPAIQFAATHEMLSEPIGAFFIAALRQEPGTAGRLGPWLGHADKATLIDTIAFLQEAGVKLAQPPALDKEATDLLGKLPPLVDPYRFHFDQGFFTRQDVLWSFFIATGDRKPVEALASMLAWKSDYDAYQGMVKRGEKPKSLTPELVRGLAFSSAGWSLGSFQRTDPLAADYLAAIAKDKSTPAPVAKELGMLNTEPAFQRSNTAK